MQDALNQIIKDGALDPSSYNALSLIKNTVDNTEESTTVRAVQAKNRRQNRVKIYIVLLLSYYLFLASFFSKNQ